MPTAPSEPAQPATPRTLTRRDIVSALKVAIDEQRDVGVDHILAPVIRAVRKRFPDMTLFDVELMLADARNEIARDMVVIDGLIDEFELQLDWAAEFDDC